MVFPKLVDITNRVDKKDIVITSDKFSIGRALRNSYVVVDIAISRYHCLLEHENEVWTIQDTSSNGTLINDLILSKDKRVLQDGDIIGFGDTLKYKFVQSPPQELSDQDIIEITNAIIDTVEEVGLLNTSSGEAAAVGIEPDSKPENATDTKELKIDEDDLTCSICAELFYKAITLTCSHTFCEYCINQWKKTNSICPVCRAKIKGQCPTLIINNLVETVLNKADDETKQRRKELIKERQPATETDPTKKETVPKSTESTSAAHASATVQPDSIIDLDLSTEDEDDEDSLDYDYDSEYDMEDYGGLPGAYYGGYGSCYTCGERGHWANGCPYNPRRRWP